MNQLRVRAARAAITSPSSRHQPTRQQVTHLIIRGRPPRSLLAPKCMHLDLIIKNKIAEKGQVVQNTLGVTRSVAVRMSGGQAASRRSTLLEPTRRLIDIRRTTHRLARSKADMRIADARNHSRYGIMVHCAHKNQDPVHGRPEMVHKVMKKVRAGRESRSGEPKACLHVTATAAPPAQRRTRTARHKSL